MLANETSLNSSLVGQVSLNAVWFISVGISSCIILLHFWIAVCVTIYAIKTRKSESKLNGGKVIISATLAVTVPTVRYLSTFSLMMVSLGAISDYNCELVIDIGKATYTVSLFFVYLFYWTRQRAFYGHPSLGQTFGRFANFMSIISITLIFVLAGAMTPLAIFPVEYQANFDEWSCVFKDGEKQYPFRNYMYFGGMLTSQIILLCLFIRPLMVHQQQAEESREQSAGSKKSVLYKMQRALPNIAIPFDSSTDNGKPSLTKNFSGSIEILSNEVYSHSKATKVHRVRSVKNNSKNKRRARVYNLIKRTLVLTAFTVVSDVITMAIIGAALPSSTSQIVTRLIYDVDLLMNTITVVLSFKNWLRILTPWRKKMGRRLDSESGSITSGVN